MPRGTLAPGPLLSAFMYGTFTLSGGPFQCPSITLLAASCRALNPTDQNCFQFFVSGLGCSAFARHYSRNRFFSSGY